jgi:NADH dehydrogenase
MRVALAGGTGFIGGHVLEALLARGHDVRALHRPGRRPARVHPALRWIEGPWAPEGIPAAIFEGCGAAINTVGLLRESRGQTYAAVHLHGAMAFFDGARSTGCPRLLQLSALGADVAAPQAFLRTKGEADARLLQGGSCAVLRPSVVYGAGDFSMATLDRLARWPLTPLPAGGRMRLQPLWVGDLAEAMVRCMEAQSFRTGAIDLGGPEALSLRELLGLLKGRPPRFVAVPEWLMAMGARMGGWFGHPLLNPEGWSMLRAGSTCDPAPLRDLLGREPAVFAQGVGLRKARG